MLSKMDYRLDALALAMSQHYRMLKEMLANVYERGAIPPKSDAVTTDAIADIAEKIGGRGLANLLRAKFTEAYISGEHEKYDIREILEFIQNETPVTSIKEEIRSRLDELISLIYRLSNPVEKKTSEPRHKKKTSTMFTQELLFPEDDVTDKDTGKKTEQKDTKTTRKRRSVAKNRRTREKIDRLADSILREEYGEERYDGDDYEEEELDDRTFGEDSYGRHYDDYTGLCEDD